LTPALVAPDDKQRRALSPESPSRGKPSAYRSKPSAPKRERGRSWKELYERGAPELRAIRRKADVHPRVAQDRDFLDASRCALVDTAPGPLDATQQDRAVARAVVDHNTWEALRDQGFGPAE
jgi:hypothetical protein